MYAPVAQRIEHRIPVPRVGGSNPFWRTKSRAREGAAFDMPGGIRIIKCDLPVAGRRPASNWALRYKTNPFWRTKSRTPEGAAFDMPGGIRIIKCDLPVAGRRPASNWALRYKTNPFWRTKSRTPEGAAFDVPGDSNSQMRPAGGRSPLSSETERSSARRIPSGVPTGVMW